MQYPEVLGVGVVMVLPRASEQSYSELETQVQMLFQKIEKSMDLTT